MPQSLEAQIQRLIDAGIPQEEIDAFIDQQLELEEVGAPAPVIPQPTPRAPGMIPGPPHVSGIPSLDLKQWEPESFGGGVAKSFLSGDVPATSGMSGVGYLKGAIANIPQNIYGAVKTIGNLAADPIGTSSEIYEGLKAFPGYVKETTLKSGSEPFAFGEMLGELLGQAPILPNTPRIIRAGGRAGGGGTAKIGRLMKDYQPITRATTPWPFRQMAGTAERIAGRGIEKVGDTIRRWSTPIRQIDAEIYSPPPPSWAEGEIIPSPQRQITGTTQRQLSGGDAPIYINPSINPDRLLPPGGITSPTRKGTTFTPDINPLGNEIPEYTPGKPPLVETLPSRGTPFNLPETTTPQGPPGQRPVNPGELGNQEELIRRMQNPNQVVDPITGQIGENIPPDIDPGVHMAAGRNVPMNPETLSLEKPNIVITPAEVTPARMTELKNQGYQFKGPDGQGGYVYEPVGSPTTPIPGQNTPATPDIVRNFSGKSEPPNMTGDMSRRQFSGIPSPPDTAGDVVRLPPRDGGGGTGRYRLPDGQIVPVHSAISKDAPTITIPHKGEMVQATRVSPGGTLKEGEVTNLPPRGINSPEGQTARFEELMNKYQQNGAGGMTLEEMEEILDLSETPIIKKRLGTDKPELSVVPDKSTTVTVEHQPLMSYKMPTDNRPLGKSHLAQVLREAEPSKNPKINQIFERMKEIVELPQMSEELYEELRELGGIVRRHPDTPEGLRTKLARTSSDPSGAPPTGTFSDKPVPPITDQKLLAEVLRKAEEYQPKLKDIGESIKNRNVVLLKEELSVVPDKEMTRTPAKPDFSSPEAIKESMIRSFIDMGMSEGEARARTNELYSGMTRKPEGLSVVPEPRPKGSGINSPGWQSDLAEIDKITMPERIPIQIRIWKQRIARYEQIGDTEAVNQAEEAIRSLERKHIELTRKGTGKGFSGEPEPPDTADDVVRFTGPKKESSKITPGEQKGVAKFEDKRPEIEVFDPYDGKPIATFRTQAEADEFIRNNPEIPTDSALKNKGWPEGEPTQSKGTDIARHIDDIKEYFKSGEHIQIEDDTLMRTIESAETKIQKETNLYKAQTTFDRLDVELNAAKAKGDSDIIEWIGNLRDTALDKLRTLQPRGLNPSEPPFGQIRPTEELRKIFISDKPGESKLSEIGESIKREKVTDIGPKLHGAPIDELENAYKGVTDWTLRKVEGPKTPDTPEITAVKKELNKLLYKKNPTPQDKIQIKKLIKTIARHNESGSKNVIPFGEKKGFSGKKEPPDSASDVVKFRKVESSPTPTQRRLQNQQISRFYELVNKRNTKGAQLTNNELVEIDELLQKHYIRELMEKK